MYHVKSVEPNVNDTGFENYLGYKYLVNLKIKDTTEIKTSASYQNSLPVEQEVNFTISLLTIVTTSISISQFASS